MKNLTEITYKEFKQSSHNYMADYVEELDVDLINEIINIERLKLIDNDKLLTLTSLFHEITSERIAENY